MKTQVLPLRLGDVLGLCFWGSVLFCLLLSVNPAWAAGKIFIPSGQEYNLGNIEEGKSYERSFIIRNRGDGELKVKAVRVGCGCTAIIYPRETVTVLPNRSIEVKFSFNTEGMEGPTAKYIYIESDDPQTPQEKIKLTAKVSRQPLTVRERFLSYSLLTIIIAGLIDGINPCAFTVLVFFISFLTFVGYRKKELLVLGITFISAVFITYILLGLGLFKFIQSLEVFANLSNIIYLVIAFLTLLLGAISLYDWYCYKRGVAADEMKLRLPDFIKVKIQKIIQDASRNKNKTILQLAAAVFISGFLVSILESVCTGQTYVPTIAYVLRQPSLRTAALGYLLLYNLMFIAPLAAILVFALLGVSSAGFSRIARRHLGTIKLLTAALFFLLGALLILVRWS